MVVHACPPRGMYWRGSRQTGHSFLRTSIEGEEYWTPQVLQIWRSVIVSKKRIVSELDLSNYVTDISVQRSNTMYSSVLRFTPEVLENTEDLLSRMCMCKSNHSGGIIA